MLTYRQLLILSYIASMTDGIQLKYLMNVLQTSEKTVKNEIKGLNQLLSLEEQITYDSKKGYSLNHISSQTQQLIEQSFQLNQEEYVDKDRTNQILMILLFERDYISMENLANHLFLSKSMLSRHLDKSWRLRKYIEVSSIKGLRIPWSELQKRNFLAKYFFLNTSTLPLLEDCFDLNRVMDQLYSIVQELFIKHDYYVSGLAFTTFYNFLLITIVRNQQQFLFDENILPIPVSKLMLEIYDAVQKDLGFTLSESDLWSCQRKLNELNVIDTEKKLLSHNVLEQQLILFCQKISDEFGLEIKMNAHQKKQFLLHMHKLKIRQENDIDVANFEKRTINNSYPLTAQIIRDYFLPIFQLDIHESEIAYIIPYFASFLEPSKETKNVLYISDSTPSLIHDSIQKLEAITQDRQISWKVFPQYYYQARKEELQVNTLMVVTTEVPVIVNNPQALLVSKMLMSQDIDLVKLYLDGCLRREDQMQLLEDERKYVLPTIQVQQKVNLLDVLQNEYLGNYQTYDLVLEGEIGYFAAFTEKSQIQIYEFAHPVLYKDHHLKKVIVANYCIQDNKLNRFYQVVRKLLTTD
ncbi:PRD domain-containing protein [Enterococcus saccharolyticus]|uniref:PRD domain-containing protein n=1 Tax=Enterococcus saccharolyticus TaxID=41997 RepID=UPI001E4A468D|nr:PRD domain-containing protein [Enterococcus saccharolyticus]MCD5002388.1 PRD domain-containing protein [Enterococcus saccharolyticus]